jgi:hypothetical protein
MQITRPFALAFLLFTGACASTPGDRGFWRGPVNEVVVLDVFLDGELLRAWDESAGDG